jgi:hypothetical protein
MISAPSIATAPSPFRSPNNGGGAGGGMLRTSPWPATAHAPEGKISPGRYLSNMIINITSTRNIYFNGFILEF